MQLLLHKRGSLAQEYLCKIGFAVFCVCAVFGELITAAISIKLLFLMHLGAVICLVLGAPFSLKSKPIQLIAAWGIFTAFFVLLRNQNDYSQYATIKWLFYALMILLIPMCPKYLYRPFLKTLGGVAFINVFFTYFFFVFRGKYRIMYRIWDKWPTGTFEGEAGYHAGIDNHYSQNAMVVAICLIVVASFLIAYLPKKDKRKTGTLAALAAVVMVALLLTNKRAHLLFGIAAILFGYMVPVPKHRLKNTLQAIGIGVVLVAAFLLLAPRIPVLNELLERFTSATSGEDGNTMARFEFWKLAFRNFLEHPLIGIGWGGFPKEYHEHLYFFNPAENNYPYLHAHNVYVQLLCECGIIGTLLYLSTAVDWFIKTIRLFDKKLRRISSEYEVVIFSVIMQTFFYMYCLTGNCLYDRMFSFYVIAIGFTVGLYAQKDVVDLF